MREPIKLRRCAAGLSSTLLYQPGLWMTADGRFLIWRTVRDADGDADRRFPRGWWNVTAAASPSDDQLLVRAAIAGVRFERRRDVIAALHAALEGDDDGA